MKYVRPAFRLISRPVPGAPAVDEPATAKRTSDLWSEIGGVEMSVETRTGSWLKTIRTVAPENTAQPLMRSVLFSTKLCVPVALNLKHRARIILPDQESVIEPKPAPVVWM